MRSAKYPSFLPEARVVFTMPDLREASENVKSLPRVADFMYIQNHLSGVDLADREEAGAWVIGRKRDWVLDAAVACGFSSPGDFASDACGMKMDSGRGAG